MLSPPLCSFYVHGRHGRGGPHPCERHVRSLATSAASRDDRHMRTLSAVALAALALIVAGCGGNSKSDTTAIAATGTPTPAATVDDSQVEQGIKENLSTSSVKVTSAKCPSGVEQKSGKTFTCNVTFSNGATGKATVTEVGPNKYTYELKSGSVQVSGEVADAALEKQLASQGIPNATVT